MPRCVPSTVRINSDRQRKCTKRGAGGYRLIRGVPRRPPQRPPARAIDGAPRRDAGLARGRSWLERRDPLDISSVHRSEVGRAFGRVHDLSRRVVIGRLTFQQRVSEISPEPGCDVLFWGHVVLAIRCCRCRPWSPPAATGWQTRKRPLSPRPTSTSSAGGPGDCSGAEGA